MKRLAALIVAPLVALLLAVLAAGACGVPLGAIRRSPPDGLDSRIAPAGARAPMFSLDGTGGPFHLADALATRHVLLVFYRGHW